MTNNTQVEGGFVDVKFIVFLKSTIAKMVATNTLPPNMIDLRFWQTWAMDIYKMEIFDQNQGTAGGKDMSQGAQDSLQDRNTRSITIKKKSSSVFSKWNFSA